MSTNTVDAETEGDQFLDGIGETALIARYPFNGTVEDSSRNSYNAKIDGDNAVFVDDEHFGKVLSLPGGEDGAFVQIPGQIFFHRTYGFGDIFG